MLKAYIFSILIFAYSCVNRQDKNVKNYTIKDPTDIKKEFEIEYQAIIDSFEKGLKKIVFKDTAGNIIPDSTAAEMTLNYQVKSWIQYDTVVLIPISEEERRKFMNTKPEESKYFKVGTKFEKVVYRDISGTVFDPEQLAGKILVLNYWFIGCLPCRQEMPKLNELVKQYSNNPNVIFLGVALDNKGDLKRFLKKTRFDYHIVAEGNKIDKYGIDVFPTHVVINQKGEVVFHCSESGDRAISWIKKSIEECLRKK